MGVINSPSFPAATLACWRFMPRKSGTSTIRSGVGSPRYTSTSLPDRMLCPAAGSWPVTVSASPINTAVTFFSLSKLLTSFWVFPVRSSTGNGSPGDSRGTPRYGRMSARIAPTVGAAITPPEI